MATHEETMSRRYIVRKSNIRDPELRDDHDVVDTQTGLVYPFAHKESAEQTALRFEMGTADPKDYLIRTNKDEGYPNR